MAIDKAGREQSPESLNTIAGIIHVNDINDDSRIAGYQYMIPRYDLLSCKYLVCLDFSVQNDWLIYCKFAALNRSDVLV